MGEKFGIIRSAELGIIVGFGWVLIFTGCLANIRDVYLAFQIAVLISGLIIMIVVSAPFWLPQVMNPGMINKVGGGTGELPEDDDETDP